MGQEFSPHNHWNGSRWDMDSGGGEPEPSDLCSGPNPEKMQLMEFNADLLDFILKGPTGREAGDFVSDVGDVSRTANFCRKVSGSFDSRRLRSLNRVINALLGLLSAGFSAGHRRRSPNRSPNRGNRAARTVTSPTRRAAARLLSGRRRGGDILEAFPPVLWENGERTQLAENRGQKRGQSRPPPPPRSRSARMPGESSGSFGLLQRTCTLVVLLCLLHISVTVVFYVRSIDFRFSFAQNQQSYGGATQQTPPGPPAGTEGTARQRDTAERTTVKPQRCPDTSPLLVGPLRVEFSSPVSLDQVRQENPSVQPGGRYRPPGCTALMKVAIIIPFRQRDEHLKFWLYYLHPILQRQQLDYGVYVINQDGDETFNRAKLLNVGYEEALKDYDYDCFVFSDVDLIPMDDRNTYRCFSQPRHLSVSMDKFSFRLPYNQYFGGVSSLSKEQYLKINGFPNNYWGWGGEDDDIYNRIVSRGMSISRPSGEVGKCRMIRHNRDKKNDPNPQRFDRISHTRETMNRDGINSLSYRVVSLEKLDLYTKITVDVGKP